MNDDHYLPPPPPPPPDGAGAEGEKADSLIRFGGRIVDGLILLVPSLVIAAVVGGSASLSGGSLGRAWLGSIVVTALQFAYYVVMETSQGRTLGKRALGLRVYGANGGLPTQDESMRRNAFLFLNIIPTFLGSLISLAASVAIAVTISNDSRGQGWHDKFAGGTRVVRERT